MEIINLSGSAGGDLGFECESFSTLGALDPRRTGVSNFGDPFSNSRIEKTFTVQLAQNSRSGAAMTKQPFTHKPNMPRSPKEKQKREQHGERIQTQRWLAGKRK